MDRYEYLIELGDNLASIGVKEMINDDNYVAGCTKRCLAYTLVR